MKYLVMECRLSYAVVLDEQGCFRKAANLNYEVGQTVTDIIEMREPTVKKASRWVRPLVSMAACMVLVFTGYFFHFMPFASVYMAINPEVRIDVSRTDRVVHVEGVNEDGRTLLTGYDPHHQDLDLVMDELVDRAIDMNYLHEGGKVTISLDADDNWVQSHQEALSHHLTDHLSTGISVTVDVEPVKAEAPPATSPGQVIVIPATPDSYGESDYGDKTDSDSGYDGPEEKDDGDSKYDPGDDKDSKYDAADEKDSKYQDGQTDYGNTSYDKEDDGETNYQPSKVPSADSGYDKDDGKSDYEAAAKDDGKTSYQPAKTPAADSGYDDDDGDSGYKAPSKNTSSGSKASSKQSKNDSGYDKDDGKSDYDKDDGKSDYEDDDD